MTHAPKISTIPSSEQATKDEVSPPKTKEAIEIEELQSYTQNDLTYHEYLRVPALLSLQHPKSEPAHHDEMLFIIIHQAYELWFKLILHEMEKAIQLIQEKQMLKAHHFLQRIAKIMSLLVTQIHILETMRPSEFLEFRDRLQPASGFQSYQFREVEFVGGLKNPSYLRFFDEWPDLRKRLEARLAGPSLRSSYEGMLRALGYDLPDDTSTEALDAKPEDRERLMATLHAIYRAPQEHLPLYLLTESLVDFDEGLSMWREHHVRVVSRIIGEKQGTGGSTGVHYLRSTTKKLCFPYLWQARTALAL